jgi:hypothetical protein
MWIRTIHPNAFIDTFRVDTFRLHFPIAYFPIDTFGDRCFRKALSRPH